MKKICLIVIFIVFPFIITHAQVGIGTPSPNGALDITSTTDGFLIPRIALTNTITATVTTPTISELVYNTANINDVTAGFYYWDGSIWVRLATSVTNGWSLLGNASTTGSNYIGTSDAVALKISTSATERIRVLANGQVIINNTAAPFAADRFSVYNTTATDTAINGYSTSSGNGVYGQNTGDGNGVWGDAFGNLGWGVYGNMSSTNGTGVVGYASGTGSDGVYGEATQSGRSGVWGVNNNVSSGFGVYGIANGTAGYGVIGTSTGSSGTGVYGQQTQSSRPGVLGVNNNTTGFGVQGTTAGATGYGVYGTGSTGYGVVGSTTGTTGYGVMGSATGTSGIGVYGIANQANRYGVYGVNNAAGGIGVVGVTTSSTGYGLYGSSAGNGTYGISSSATAFGIIGQNSSATGTGILGAGNNLGGFYSGNGSGGAFTGTTYGSVNYGITTASGIGIAAAGNNAAITIFDGNGAGGAFSGNQWGVTSIAKITGAANDATNRGVLAGSYISGGSITDNVYVGARIAGVNYKILGTGGGSVSTTMKTSQGERILFAPEAPENWFFDVGEVTLVNGSAKVQLDPVFVETISDSKPFKVFVQGGENTLGSIRITRNQKEKSFLVEDLGGPSNGVVQYNIYAIWKGKENLRLPELKEENKPKPITIESQKITQEQQKISAKNTTIAPNNPSPEIDLEANSVSQKTKLQNRASRTENPKK